MCHIPVLCQRCAARCTIKTQSAAAAGTSCRVAPPAKMPASQRVHNSDPAGAAGGGQAQTSVQYWRLFRCPHGGSSAAAQGSLPPHSLQRCSARGSFADRTDALLLLLGTAGALVHGAARPLFTVIIGAAPPHAFCLTLRPDGQSAGSAAYRRPCSAHQRPATGNVFNTIGSQSGDLQQVILDFVYIAIVAFAAGFWQMAGFMLSGAPARAPACWSTRASAQAPRVPSQCPEQVPGSPRASAPGTSPPCCSRWACAVGEAECEQKVPGRGLTACFTPHTGHRLL